MTLVPARNGSLCLVESSQGSMDSRGSQGLTRPGNFPKSLRFPETLVHEIGQEQLERLLLWCVEMRASDIVFCPGDPVWLQRDGMWFPVTDTPLNDAEIQAIVNTTSGQSNRAGLVKTGHSIDYAATVRIPGQRVLRQRFRVNATSSNKGLYVVMRVLPGSIPRLDDMEGLTSAQKKALFPEAGLVVVSGVMGSGKSTLLAAILHEASLKSGRQILTLEDPIEFDFSQLPIEERAAPITQSAVHIDVEDWASGVRTLTRRKGEIVMVGECRDRETIRALLTTVEQGVAAYTTVHAQDVPQTITRMVNAFPEDKRAGVASVLCANVRVLIHQRLVPRAPKAMAPGVPGRVALREILVLDRELGKGLCTLPLQDLLPTLNRMVREHGQSMEEDAAAKLHEGLIGRETFAMVCGKMPR